VPAAYLDHRVAATRARLAALDADALLVTHLPNVAWLTGFFASSGAVVLTGSAVHLLSDFRYGEHLARMRAAGDLPTGTEIEIVEGGLDAAAAALIERLGLAVVAFEAEHLAVRRFTRLQRLLPKGARLVPADPFMERLRAEKDAVEIGLYREAVTRLAEVTARIPSLISVGREERELAALIDLELKRAGFERTAFETIVASGPNSALPHARPSSRRLGPGDGVVLDFGGVYAGYCVDLTRTAFIGRPTESFLRLFAAVTEAQAAAVAAVKSGVRASEIDAAARRMFAAHGLERAFGHATGHGLGIEVHEFPRIGRAALDAEDPVLRDGMIVTIEPGVYVPEVGGVRIEDDVLVGPEGGEVLTDMIPRGLMTPGAR
jgi:Xaa-Pro aminopeptidase